MPKPIRQFLDEQIQKLKLELAELEKKPTTITIKPKWYKRWYKTPRIFPDYELLGEKSGYRTYIHMLQHQLRCLDPNPNQPR